MRFWTDVVDLEVSYLAVDFGVETEVFLFDDSNITPSNHSLLRGAIAG